MASKDVKCKKSKYYGVTKGRLTGIFTSWSKCNDQIDKLSGSCFKSFDELHECVAFMLVPPHGEAERVVYVDADSIPVYGPKGKLYDMQTWLKKVDTVDNVTNIPASPNPGNSGEDSVVVPEIIDIWENGVSSLVCGDLLKISNEMHHATGGSPLPPDAPLVVKLPPCPRVKEKSGSGAHDTNPDSDVMIALRTFEAQLMKVIRDDQHQWRQMQAHNVTREHMHCDKRIAELEAAKIHLQKKVEQSERQLQNLTEERKLQDGTLHKLRSLLDERDRSIQTISMELSNTEQQIRSNQTIVDNSSHVLKDYMSQNKQLLRDLKEKSDGYMNERLENQKLRVQISELSRTSQKEQWSKFRNKHSTLLVGSSIIRDVSASSKDANIDVVSVSGGTLMDVRNELNNRKQKHSNVIIQAGSNDCSSGTDVDDVVSDYKHVIRAAKAATADGTVVISAVLPRHDEPRVFKMIQSLNSRLQAIATEEGCSFVEHRNFYLSEDEANDGYFLTDKIHLTSAGSKRIISDLGLTSQLIYRDRRKQTPHASGHSSTPLATSGARRQHLSTPRQPRDDLQHREAINPTVPRTLKRREPHDYNKQQHQRQVRCDYCYEQGHVKQKCGHGRPVICRACGEEGHKEKFCAPHSDGHYDA